MDIFDILTMLTKLELRCAFRSVTGVTSVSMGSPLFLETKISTYKQKGHR